jgi:hypothetical protein
MFTYRLITKGQLVFDAVVDPSKDANTNSLDHKTVVALNIGAENSTGFTFKTFICRGSASLVKVSNKKSRYVGDSEKRKQMRNQIRFRNQRTASDQV